MAIPRPLNRLAIVFAPALIAMPISTRAAELFSESVFVPPLPTYQALPVTGWNNFKILLTSDPNLPPQDRTDPDTNPFLLTGNGEINSGGYFPVASDAGTFSGPGPIISGDGLRAITYFGNGAINQAHIPAQNLGNPADYVQFGLTGPADNSVMHFLAQHWHGSYAFSIAGGGNYLRGVPVVSVTPHPAPPATPPPGESFKYIVDFIQFTQNGIDGTEWVEFPYLPGQQPTFTYGGWADAANFIHFTKTEIQLSDTQIPIDQLNFAGDPLSGGLSGPAFISVENAPDVVPEPASVGLIGAAVVMSLRRRLQ